LLSTHKIQKLKNISHFKSLSRFLKTLIYKPKFCLLPLTSRCNLVKITIKPPRLQTGILHILTPILILPLSYCSPYFFTQQSSELEASFHFESPALIFAHQLYVVLLIILSFMKISIDNYVMMNVYYLSMWINKRICL